MTGAVRRLCREDAEAWREIRLEALKSEPAAFGAAYEDNLNRSLSDFVDQLDRSRIFAAFLDGRPAGIVGWYRFQGRRVDHRGQVIAVYVREAARGHGIGDQLMQAVIEDATGTVRQLELGVGTWNVPASRLYRRHGFMPTGIVPRAIRTEQGMFDEITMVLTLDEGL